MQLWKRCLSRVIYRGLAPFVREVSGTEHFPRTGPCVLVANHLSVLDGLVMAMVMNCRLRQTHFVSYQYLFRNPLIGFMLRQNGGVVLDETTAAGRERALDECRRLLAAGQVVGLFPEAHTAPYGEMLKAQPGGAMLALESFAPVVPVGLTGTGKVVPRRGELPGVRWKAVTVRFGPPVDLAGPARLFAAADKRRRLDIVLGASTIIMRSVAALSGQTYPHGAKSLERLERLLAESGA